MLDINHRISGQVWTGLFEHPASLMEDRKILDSNKLSEEF